MISLLDTKQLFSKMFLWLAIGLLITFGVGYYVQSNDELLVKIFAGGTHLILALITVILAIVLQKVINKLKSSTALILYFVYAALEGLTFSAIFALYNIQSILHIFGITGMLFLVFGLFGYFTKYDLSKLTTFLFIGLIGTLISYVVNMFVGSENFNLLLAITSLIIFTTYIAYDINVIKRRLVYTDDDNSLAILGALWLHIDIIAIIYHLLEIFEERR